MLPDWALLGEALALCSDGGFTKAEFPTPDGRVSPREQVTCVFLFPVAEASGGCNVCLDVMGYSVCTRCQDMMSS